MTKQIAEAVGKPERTVKGWATKAGAKLASAGAKLASAGAKNRGVSALDYIEDEGMLPAVVAIAREVFGGAA